MRNDFLGKEINLGDTVICIVPKYRELALCEVVDFTAKMVRVKFIKFQGDYLTCGYSKIGDTILQTGAQLTVVPKL